MHDGSFVILQSLTLLFVLAGLIGSAFALVRLPAILAFILTGLIIGPGGLGLIANTGFINAISQLGIIFLMFVLGAELSLPRLKEMRMSSVWSGVIQLTLTIGVLSLLLGLLGISWQTAVFLASALSLSSTAIVLKSLGDQNELDTSHGRITMGILIVQDLSLVVLMTVMPSLINETSDVPLVNMLGIALLKAALFLGVVILLSWRFLPRMIDRVAAWTSKNTFVVFIVSFGMLMALLAEQLGLSYAVGAFIAGLALSRSLTSRQIVADSMLLRDLFATVFFVSVGMLMDTRFLFSHLSQVLGFLVAISVIKTCITAVAITSFRLPFRTVMWCALSLFQVGELSFILIQGSAESLNLPENLLATLNSAIVLSMLVTPLVMRSIPGILTRIIKTPDPGPFTAKQQPDSPEMFQDGPRTAPLKDEVVIAGYGPVARNLVQILHNHEIGFRIIEMNVNTVKRLQEKGIHCIYGDASNIEVLHHANLQEAKVFAVTMPDVRAAELAIQNAKLVNPDIYCIVRSRYQAPLSTLFQLGADEVVYEEFETSMSFIYSILDVFGSKVTDRESYRLLVRENREALLRAGQNAEDEARYGRFSVFKDTKIEWIAVPEGSPLIGMTLSQASLRQRAGVNVLSIIHPDGRDESNPTSETVIEANQVLVVIGTLDQLNALEVLLC